MPRAVIEADRCRPELCERGVCQARSVCPVKAIQQIDPYDLPRSDWGRCHACSKCLLACPQRAIVIR